VKTKPVVFRLLALFGVKITSNQERPSDHTSPPGLHLARLLALQSKLNRMGCGWIILNTEAPQEASRTHMTADVAKPSDAGVNLL